MPPISLLDRINDDTRLFHEDHCTAVSHDVVDVCTIHEFPLIEFAATTAFAE